MAFLQEAAQFNKEDCSLYWFHIDANLASGMVFYLDRHAECPVLVIYLTWQWEHLGIQFVPFQERTSSFIQELGISGFRTIFPPPLSSEPFSCFVFSKWSWQASENAQLRGETPESTLKVSVEVAEVSFQVRMTFFLGTETLVGGGSLRSPLDWPPWLLVASLLRWLGITAGVQLPRIIGPNVFVLKELNQWVPFCK